MKDIGYNRIPNEFYRKGGNEIQEGLGKLSNKIAEDKQVIENWNIVKLTLIHKKGKDPTLIQNYRPIAVANNITNIYSGLIKQMLTTILEQEIILSQEQNGFRKNRRGSDNLYIVN